GSGIQRLPVDHGRDVRHRLDVHRGQPGGRSDLCAARPADSLRMTTIAVAPAPAIATAAARPVLRRSRGWWQLLLRNRMAMTGAAVILVWVVMVLAFPSLILAMAIAAALGPSIQNSMLAMLLVWWPPYARLARGQVLSLKNREFVVAARALGMSELRVLLRHVLPNSVAQAL